jgi:hypothetical protein
MEDTSPTFTFMIGDKSFRILVQRDRYSFGGNLAVLLFEEETGEPFATASVNVEGIELADDEFVFKTYSENEGLLEAMLEAGIVAMTGRSADVGPICRLLRSVKSDGDGEIRMEPPPPRNESDFGPIPEWLRKGMQSEDRAGDRVDATVVGEHYRISVITCTSFRDENDRTGKQWTELVFEGHLPSGERLELFRMPEYLFKDFRSVVNRAAEFVT